MEDLIKFVQGLVPERIKPFINALVAGIAILIALSKLIEPLTSLRRDRRQSIAVQRRLDEATNATKFWEAWFRTNQLVQPEDQTEAARARVRSELQNILQKLEEPLPLPRTARSHPSGRNLWRRALLAYRPKGVVGWLQHLGFYLLFLFLIFYFFGISIDPATGDMSWRFFVSHLNENLAPALVFVVPLVLLNLSARWRERRRELLDSERAPASS